NAPGCPLERPLFGSPVISGDWATAAPTSAACAVPATTNRFIILLSFALVSRTRRLEHQRQWRPLPPTATAGIVTDYHASPRAPPAAAPESAKTGSREIGVRRWHVLSHTQRAQNAARRCAGRRWLAVACAGRRVCVSPIWSFRSGSRAASGELI